MNILDNFIYSKASRVLRIMNFLFLTFMMPFIFTAERDVNEVWCLNNGGNDNYRTDDDTYVDCLTDKYAIEAEYDYNWKEAIGQALHYAESTNRKAGILFIKRAESGKDYHGQMMRVINKYKLPIEIFVVEE